FHPCRPTVMLVPPKDLVATQSREHYFQPRFTRRLADEVRIEAVDGRLIHRINKRRELALEISARHPDFLVVGVESPGNRRSRLRLAKLALIEDHGKGLQPLALFFPGAAG